MKHNAFSLKSRKKGCPFLPILFIIVLDVGLKAINQKKKEIKGNKIEKDKTSLYCLCRKSDRMYIIKATRSNG